jgi:ribA/ribD-fused uncharacterized protein
LIHSLFFTDTHIYFFGYDTGSKYDCFQQWYPSTFEEPALADEAEQNSFPTSEHYMMAMKARLMRDEQTARKITAAATPAEAKTLGREVKNFNQGVSETRICIS